MIASIQYTCTGTEPGSIYFNPCSGKEIIDVLVDGYSFLHVGESETGTYRAVVDNNYGLVSLPEITKGMLVQVIYKTLPTAIEEIVMSEFSPLDFAAGEFA